MQDLRRKTLGTLPVVSKWCQNCGAEAGAVSIDYYGYFATDYSCRCAICGVECHYHPLRPDWLSEGIHAEVASEEKG